jgi:hypothetical protein
MQLPMTVGPGPAPRRRGIARLHGRLLGGVALSMTVALVSLASLGAASPYAPGDPVAWTNGTVLCQFAPSSPLVSVSALSVADSGLSASMVGLSELRPDGTAVAAADLSGLAWNVDNLSTDDAYDLEFTTEAPIETGEAGAPPVGSVNLSVQFVLPAYDGSPAGSMDEVTVVVAESGWTWQTSGDHLAMTLGGAPTFPVAEHLTGSAEAGWILSSVANSTGAEREQLGVNGTATATWPGGMVSTVPADASLAIASPEWATVTVAFGSGAGDFSSLSFTARVGVVLPATVAGVPLPELLAAAGAAALVSVLVAVSARRLRRRPSRLVYVEEEP